MKTKYLAVREMLPRIVWLGLLLLPASDARSTTVLDSPSYGVLGPTLPANGYVDAIRINTGSNAWTLGKISVSVRPGLNLLPIPTLSASLHLYADSGGAPGLELLNFGTNSASGSSVKAMLFSTPSFFLSPETDYWIGLRRESHTGDLSPFWVAGNLTGGTHYTDPTQARRFCFLWWALRTSHLDLKYPNRIRCFLHFCKVKMRVTAFNFCELIFTGSLAISLAVVSRFAVASRPRTCLPYQTSNDIFLPPCVSFAVAA